MDLLKLLVPQTIHEGVVRLGYKEGKKNSWFNMLRLLYSNKTHSLKYLQTETPFGPPKVSTVSLSVIPELRDWLAFSSYNIRKLNLTNEDITTDDA